jgi:uncharacterized protein YndB with AHSA1/START domain
MTTDTIADTELLMTRTFDAPAERVFDAWLSESVAEWIGPQGVRAEISEFDPRVGGKYRIIMNTPDGNRIPVGGIYKEIDRPKRLVFSWGWEKEDQDTLVTLTFRETGGKTEMTLKHTNFADSTRRDSHKHGWTGSFDKLESFLAT